MLSKRLMNRMLIVVLLAGLEGFFGWIMVASGLTQRPWVNAYNLTLHLCMGLVIFSYLLWTTFIAYQPRPASYDNPRLKRFGWVMLGITFLQIALGAMMSGAKAGLFFPTWPDMNGTYLPGLLLDANNWVGDSFIHYDTNPFMPALIQFLHRNTAYILTVMVLYYAWKQAKVQISDTLRKANWVLVGTLFLQVLLGIFTLINCKSKVPVDLGVSHQACAVLLLACMLFVNYQMKNREFS
jgi:cytochrome c oxidase assembly protein subunit 15